MRKTEIIQRLNELDLRCCEDRDIIELIDNNSYALQFINIDPGQVVYRATVLSDAENIESVDTRRLSYKLAKDNHKYQRASIPGNTMFYGVMPNCEEENYKYSGIAAAFFETSAFFRDTPYQTKWSVHVVSEWIATEPLTLLAIADPCLDNKSYRLNNCAEGFRSFVSQKYPPQIAADEIIFQEFIFKHFSTPVNENYEYRISALFANKFLEEAKRKDKKIDGLVWQSAINSDDKLDDCLCVAISPETIESSFLPPTHFLFMKKYNSNLERKELVNS